MFDKIIPLWLKDRTQLSIWIAVSSLISLNWFLSESNILIQAISQLLTSLLVKITVSLFLLSIGLIASLISISLKNHAEPKIDDYNFIDPPGYYTHKKKRGRYCQYCLLTKPYIESPLHTDVNTLKCNVCKNTIDNPGYKSPPMPEPKNLGPHGWMAK